MTLLSVSLMVADHRFQHLQALRSLIATVVYPIQYALDLPVRAVGLLGEQFSSRRLILDESRTLRAENLALHAILLRHEALELENARLRDLLDSSRQLREPVMVAELLSVDLDPFRQQIVINKGSRDGAYMGQPVIDARGVVGQVVEAHRLHAVALLITDPSHSIPVQVQRTGLRTIAFGTGNPAVLELRFIPPSEDISVGDVLTTSGLGGRFPPDYPVAKVIRVERSPGEAFAQVEARPLALLDRGREVLLLRPGNRGAMDGDPE